MIARADHVGKLRDRVETMNFDAVVVETASQWPIPPSR
jgi:hypothetical protein